MRKRMKDDWREMKQIWRVDYSPRARKVCFTMLSLVLAFLWMFLAMNLYKEDKSLLWIISEASAKLMLISIACLIALLFEYVVIGVWMSCE